MLAVQARDPAHVRLLLREDERDARARPPGAWHELVAGTAGARLLCMCVPPYSHDDTYFD